MQKIINWYRYFNILSLDVALGAVISTIFLAKIFGVNGIRLQGIVCLGLVVWLIYTADHLLDAKMIKRDASTLRHRFHQRHFSLILSMSGIAFLFTIPLLFFIHKPLLISGLILSALVVLYFLIQRKLSFAKEIFGAMLYCMGVMLPIIALSEMSFQVFGSIPFILFFNTALINLILFSWFDKERDQADNHQSLVIKVGNTTSKMVLGLLFSIQFGLMIYAYSIGVIHSMLYVFVLMNLVLLLIFMKYKWFAVEDRYRLVGDAVFLIPIIYLVFK